MPHDINDIKEFGKPFPQGNLEVSVGGAGRTVTYLAAHKTGSNKDFQS